MIGKMGGCALLADEQIGLGEEIINFGMIRGVNEKTITLKVFQRLEFIFILL